MRDQRTQVGMGIGNWGGHREEKELCRRSPWKKKGFQSALRSKKGFPTLSLLECKRGSRKGKRRTRQKQTKKKKQEAFLRLKKRANNNHVKGKSVPPNQTKKHHQHHIKLKEGKGGELAAGTHRFTHGGKRIDGRKEETDRFFAFSWAGTRW